MTPNFHWNTHTCIERIRPLLPKQPHNLNRPPLLCGVPGCGLLEGEKEIGAGRKEGKF